MNFNEAVKALSEGKTITRKSWGNGTMFLYLDPEKQVLAEACRDPRLKECAIKNGESIKIISNICMVVYNGENGGFIIPGWFANQSDSLAEDWLIIGARQ